MGVGAEDVAFEGEAVGEAEVEEADEGGVVSGDEEFFSGFADGALGWGFAGVEFTAWAVDFACAEPAFFADEEDLVVVEDEHERGAHGRVP